MNDNQRIKEAFEEGTRIDEAMNRSFHAAVRLHRLHDVPLVLWEDGKVRYVDPHEILLPGEDAQQRGEEERHGGKEP